MAWTTSTDPRRSYASFEATSAEIAGWMARGKVLFKSSFECRNPGIAICGGAAAATGLVFAAFGSGTDALLVVFLSIVLACMTWTIAFAGARTAGIDRDGFRATAEFGESLSSQARNLNTEHHSMARLTSRMSHDLRTPLNAVIGFSELMRNEIHGPVGNERYREYIEHIGQSGEQLLKATEDTLTMTSLIARPVVPAESFTVADVVQETPWIDLELGPELDRLEGIRLTGDRDTLELAIDRLCQALGERSSLATRYRLHVTETCDRAVLTFAPTGDAELQPANALSKPLSEYPGVEEDLQLCVLATMFELLGSSLTWVPGTDRSPSAVVAIETNAQHDLPF